MKEKKKVKGDRDEVAKAENIPLSNFHETTINLQEFWFAIHICDSAFPGNYTC